MIEKYRKKFEASENARTELQDKIMEKTGHPCVASTQEFSHKDETEYKIMCFTGRGLKAVSRLFTDKPFYQEEIMMNEIESGLLYRVSCTVRNLGAPLEIFVHMNAVNYREWVKDIHVDWVGDGKNE